MPGSAKVQLGAGSEGHQSPAAPSSPVAFLPSQVAARDEALRSAEARLTALRDDFDYNLGLLEARDAELAAHAAALHGMGEELGAKADLLAAMQQAVSQAEQGKGGVQGRLCMYSPA